MNCENTNTLTSGSSDLICSSFLTNARNFVLDTKSTLPIVTAVSFSVDVLPSSSVYVPVMGLTRLRLRWTDRRSDKRIGPLSQTGQLAGLFWSSQLPM